MSSEKNPVFAGRSVKFWAQFTKEQLINDWGLNEKQIPLLEEQLSYLELKLPEKAKVQEGDGVEKTAIETPSDGVDTPVTEKPKKEAKPKP